MLPRNEQTVLESAVAYGLPADKVLTVSQINHKISATIKDVEEPTGRTTLLTLKDGKIIEKAYISKNPLENKL